MSDKPPVIKITQVHKGCGSGCGSGCLLIILGFIVISIFFPSVLKNSPERPTVSPQAAAPSSSTEGTSAAVPPTTTEANNPIKPEAGSVVAPAQSKRKLRDIGTFPVIVVLQRRLSLVDDTGIRGLDPGATVQIQARNSDTYHIVYEDRNFSVPKSDVDDATEK